MARLEVAAGEGALRTLVDAVAVGDAEVVDERPVAVDGLGPHAGPGADDVGRPDLGDVALGGPHVGALRRASRAPP